jgi:hypothetical protein
MKQSNVSNLLSTILTDATNVEASIMGAGCQEAENTGTFIGW